MAVSDSLLLRSLPDTSFEEPLGSPTFALLPLVACRALGTPGASSFPSHIGEDDVCLLSVLRTWTYPILLFQGSITLLHITAYTLPVYA
jgi:hypothetical protein